MLQLLKYFFFVLMISFISNNICGQKISYLDTKNSHDSSFYDLIRIGPNEFWAGGENGALTIIDSSGNHRIFPKPLGQYNILKFIKKDSLVLIFTDDEVVFGYDIQHQILTQRKMEGFKNKCFYDAIMMNDGKIMICGGTTGIARHRKVIPNGFIAITDMNLSSPKIIWKSKRKFVWHLSQNHRKEIFAAVFNGINTHLIRTLDGKRWKCHVKTKGLAHEINCWDSTIYYSGCRSIKYLKTGIIGSKLNQNSFKQVGGCVWSMEKDNDQIIGSNQEGEAIIINKENPTSVNIIPIVHKAIYDLEIISKGKWLFVGHGQTIAILEE